MEETSAANTRMEYFPCSGREESHFGAHNSGGAVSKVALTDASSVVTTQTYQKDKDLSPFSHSLIQLLNQTANSKDSCKD
jgi:hypothetical protein